MINSSEKKLRKGSYDEGESVLPEDKPSLPLEYLINGVYMTEDDLIIL